MSSFVEAPYLLLSSQAQDTLARTKSELEAATSAAEQLRAQEEHSSGLLGEMRQLLEAAEQQLSAAQEAEAALRSRCAELEGALQEVQSAAEADAGAAEEAQAAAEEAQQQAHRLQRQLEVAEAQARGACWTVCGGLGWMAWASYGAPVHACLFKHRTNCRSI